MRLHSRLVLATLVCAGALRAQDPNPAAYLRFHTQAAAGDSAIVLRMKSDTARVRFAARPALDLRGVAKAAMSRSVTDGFDVVVELTKEGRARVQEMADKLAGQRLAIMVDDRLTEAPVIDASLREASIVISRGRKTEASAARMANEINVRIAQLKSKGTGQ
jgi:preprotein translocase subunit SecD